MAYFTAPAYYNIVREMPAGKGFADFVFIPRANVGKRPAMVVELKYNKSADTAIKPIKEKEKLAWYCPQCDCIVIDCKELLIEY